MFTNLIRLAVPFALVAATIAGPARAEDDTQTFVEFVYETGWESISTDSKTRHQMLTPEFAKAVAADLKKDESAQLGFDPLVGTETADVSDITTDVADETDDTVKVDVSFKNGGNDGKVEFVLSKTKKGLKLDDIVLSDRGSVREQLAAAKEATEPKAKSTDTQEKVKDITIKADSGRGAEPAKAPAKTPKKQTSEKSKKSNKNNG